VVGQFIQVRVCVNHAGQFLHVSNSGTAMPQQAVS
jgi:hypothetical protein